MQLTETITIINKSGKIIGNGKHFVSIFKDAKAAYQEKKAALSGNSRSPPDDDAQLPIPGHLKKSHTLANLPQHGEQSSRSNRRTVRQHSQDYDAADLPRIEHLRLEDGRRRSVDDVRSSGGHSHRSHGTHWSRKTRPHGDGARSVSDGQALTRRNLKTLSQASSTRPSQPPATYRSPYAETAPRDALMSRPTLVRANTLGDMGQMMRHAAPPPVYPPSQAPAYPAAPHMAPMSPSQPMPPMWHDQIVYRQRSGPNLRQTKNKEIDMNLAYGSIPPDLQYRVDLDPAFQEAAREAQARTLMSTIDKMMLEAKCVHHTATDMIAKLQKDPEKAAAVALSLGELSTILGKLSPGFLAGVKLGFPHIFAILASPQFLMGAGALAGVSIIIFGGWKIVKRIKEASDSAKMKEAQAMMMPAQYPQPLPYVPLQAHEQYPMLQYQHQYPPMQPMYGYENFHFDPQEVPRGPDGTTPSHDDALVLDEEMSVIDSWRRGIPAFDDEESTVDFELITPDAMRSVRADRHRDAAPKEDYHDDNSGIADTESQRSGRTRRTHRSHRSSGTRRHRSEEGHDRRSRSYRAEVQTVDGDDARSERTQRSSRSKRTMRTSTRLIEDGSRDREENSLESVLGKEKKNSMLKQLFKKNDGPSKSALSLATRK